MLTLCSVTGGCVTVCVCVCVCVCRWTWEFDVEFVPWTCRYGNIVGVLVL